MKGALFEGERELRVLERGASAGQQPPSATDMAWAGSRARRDPRDVANDEL
jgi:hypothetical protein